MEELEIIRSLGFVTSSELAGLIQRNKKTLIQKLNRMEGWKELFVIKTNSPKGITKFYCDNDLFQHIRKVK